jgi:sulfide:quinone oxidoreductase
MRPPAPISENWTRMAHRIVILGGGTGGTLTANRLQREYGSGAEIVVVDRDDRHVYQPALVFVPFGMADPARIVRSRSGQLRDGIEFRTGVVDQVDVERSVVHLADGAELSYDVLVIATGAELLPGETEGMSGPGWGERVFTFYSLEGASALHRALRTFDSGRLVVNFIDVPIKCPVAPLEFCFLADWYLRRRGVRHRVDLRFVTPLDGAFTRPAASAHLAGLMERKGIGIETEFATGEIDGRGGRLVSWDEREVEFDLLATVPLHGGAAFAGRSPGLCDDLGFVPTDPHTLQSRAAENVFVIGDATDIATSKAGSVAHFEGETLVANVRRFLAGEPLQATFDGHANCFIETGFHKALLIDFNYDYDPVPGRYPWPHAGPLPLLKESRLNHMGKLMFQPIYWHMLLPGREIPGIAAAMRPPAQPAETNDRKGAPA